MAGAALHSRTVKHHYVPQFLLRRWTNTAGRLRSFSFRHGKLVSKDLAPRYTGFENGLYALAANALGIAEDTIERRLFSPLDNNAAKVLAKLERHEQITEDDHIAWTFFLSSLKVRQPETLKFLRTKGMELLSATLAMRDEGTLPKGWPATESWFDRNLPGVLASKALSNWLPRMITNEDVLDRFGSLKWWFREMDPDDGSLLLADMPLHWEGSFKGADFMIKLPIAPNRLFLGTASEETEAILI